MNELGYKCLKYLAFLFTYFDQQWATLSRDLVDYILDTQSHWDVWRMYDFHMQTSGPIDCFFLTLSKVSLKKLNNFDAVSRA